MSAEPPPDDFPEDLIPAREAVRRALTEIMEHVDACQIFVSKVKEKSEDGTQAYADGKGNWFARYGQVREWVLNKEYDSNVKADEEDL